MKEKTFDEKVLAITKRFAFLGLLLGLLYAFGGLIIDSLLTLGWLHREDTPGLSMGTVYAFGAIIGMPFLFACLGFLMVLVWTWTNLVFSTLHKND